MLSQAQMSECANAVRRLDCMQNHRVLFTWELFMWIWHNSSVESQDFLVEMMGAWKVGAEEKGI
jgi:hypothetical protein